MKARGPIVQLLRKILTRREKRNLILLFAASVVTAAFELLGIGSILPFITLATNPEAALQSRYIHFVYDLLGSPSATQFLLIVGIAVIIVTVLGNICMAGTMYAIVRYSTMREYSFSVRLLRQYLRRDYAFFLDINTAELTRNILGEVSRAVSEALMPALESASKLIVTVAITVALFFLNPFMAAIALTVFGGGYAGIYLLVRPRLNRLGAERLAANRRRYKAIAEVFGAIKEVKLIHSEEEFTMNYAHSALIHAKRDAVNRVVSQVPRYAVEPIAFTALVAMVLYLTQRFGGLSTALPMVTAFAFGGYRLMPALQIVFSGASRLRFGLPSLGILVKDLANEPTAARTAGPVALKQPRAADGLPSRQAQGKVKKLCLSKVTFTYRNQHSPAIDDVTLQIPAHTSVAFVGRTGSGKTTLLDIMLGLLRQQSGMVSVNGVDIDDETLPQWQARLGYVPQQIFLSDDTVARNIAIGVPVDKIDREAIVRVSKMAKIHEFILEHLPRGYDTEIGERGIRLSGGQRQRIGIARALYRDPEVLMLDEATNALDDATESTVMDAINRLAARKTLVIVAHRMTTVRKCNVIHVLDHGRIVASGSYQELLQTSPAFQELIGSNDRERPADE
jgi:ABC-type multidrug transport system fused ATPase/permease subunit